MSSPKRRISFPLRRMDVAISDQDAPLGTLRAVVNMCPLGTTSQGDYHWSPVETADQRAEEAGLVAIGSHVRQRVGPFADSGATKALGLERIVAITAGDPEADPVVTSKILVIDPSDLADVQDDDGNDLTRFEVREVYDYGAATPGRRAQFAQVSESLFIAGSVVAAASGEGYGQPEPLLELRDDTVLPFDFPELPRVGLTMTENASNTNGLPQGTYSYRYAWRLKDGTIGPASIPHFFFCLPAADASISLTFTIDEYLSSLDADWTKLIDGIEIMISPGFTSDTEPTAIASIFLPHYRITSIGGTSVGSSVDVEVTREEISGNPVHEDDQLAQHGIEAAAVTAYNKRLILGDVAYDFKRPNILHNSRPYTSGSDWYVRLGVVLETPGGTFERISDPLGLATADAQAWNPNGVDVEGGGYSDGFLMYPDPRVTEFRLYVSSDGTTYTLHSSYAASKATNLNVAFNADIGQQDLTTGGGTAMPDLATIHAETDHDVNRLLVSDVYRPRQLRASRARYVGNGPEDAIIGMAVNSLPISEGQFGAYPLYVLCAESVWAGRVGTGDVAFESFEPVSSDRGCVGRYAFTNVDNVVAFASRDGVWMIRPRLDDVPVSEPLTQHKTINDIYSCLTYDTALGYYNDRSRGRRELWVAAGVLVFGFAVQKDRWFILDRARRQFLLFKNVLYGINKREVEDEQYIDPDTGEVVTGPPPLEEGELADGVLVDEGAKDDPIDVSIRTSRLALFKTDRTRGEQTALGTWKRIYKIWVRQRGRMDELFWRLVDLKPSGIGYQITGGRMIAAGTDAVGIAGASALFPFVEIYGTAAPGDGLESVGIEYTTRYEHRRPETMPQLADPEDEYQFYLTYTPWDCREGIQIIEGGPPWWELTNVLAILPQDLECNVVDVVVKYQTDPWWELQNINAQEKQADQQPGLECNTDNVLVEFTPNTAPWWELYGVTANQASDAPPDPGGGTAPHIRAYGNIQWREGMYGLIYMEFEDEDGDDLEYIQAQLQVDPADVELFAVLCAGWNGSSWDNLSVQETITPAALTWVNTATGYAKKRIAITARPAPNPTNDVVLAELVGFARDASDALTVFPSGGSYVPIWSYVSAAAIPRLVYQDLIGSGGQIGEPQLNQPETQWQGDVGQAIEQTDGLQLTADGAAIYRECYDPDVTIGVTVDASAAGQHQVSILCGRDRDGNTISFRFTHPGGGASPEWELLENGSVVASDLVNAASASSYDLTVVRGADLDIQVDGQTEHTAAWTDFNATDWDTASVFGLRRDTGQDATRLTEFYVDTPL